MAVLRALASSLDGGLWDNITPRRQDRETMMVVIQHVGLLVHDLEAACNFYNRVIGLSRVERPDLGYPGAWFGLANGQTLHLLALAAEPLAAADRPGREHHVAFAIDDLEGLARRLAAAGVTVTHSRSGRPALFCQDPDGNVLEFIAMSP